MRKLQQVTLFSIISCVLYTLETFHAFWGNIIKEGYYDYQNVYKNIDNIVNLTFVRMNVHVKYIKPIESNNDIGGNIIVK